MDHRKAARRRHARLKKELEDLKKSNAHRYQARLAQLHRSWENEMYRRRNLLRAPPVWAFVEYIEAILGEEHAKDAAQMAVLILEKVQQRFCPRRNRRRRSGLRVRPIQERPST
jgi:hypothetical protein